nr:hypothetical protein [Labilibaculum sp.]
MIMVHVVPKIHPGGVHGALAIPTYQSDGTPLLVKIPAIASAVKLSIRNINNL